MIKKILKGVWQFLRLASSNKRRKRRARELGNWLAESAESTEML